MKPFPILFFLGALWLTIGVSCGRRADRTDAARADSVVVCCRQTFDRGRSFQRDGQAAEAIETFRACLHFDSSVPAERDSLLPWVSDALVQLLNTYQSQGMADSCALCFDALRRRPPSHLLVEQGWRDLCVVSAYALSRTERMDEAYLLMDSALALPLHQPTPARLFRDYAYASAVFFAHPDRQEDAIAWGQRALALADSCPELRGRSYVASVLGMMYKRTGRLYESVDLLQQSLDEARAKNDSLAQINSYNSLASLYLYWNLPGYAARYAIRAVALAQAVRTDNPMIAMQSYLLHAESLRQLGRKDSALECFRMAAVRGEPLPYNSGLSDVECLIGALLVQSSGADSVAIGLDLLRKVAALGTPVIRARAYYHQAEGYFRQHRPAMAEAALDSMYALLHQGASPLYLGGVDYGIILRHYIRKGDFARLSQHVQDLLYEHELSIERKTTARLYENIVQFQTEKERREYELATARMKNVRLRWTVVLVLLAAACVILLLVFISRRRVYRMRQLLLEQRLHRLMDTLETSRQQTYAAEHRLSALLDDPSSRAGIEALMPSLLRDEGDAAFRNRFEQLYPTFLSRLRKEAPGVTRREELLCMLIALGQDTGQTSYLLGIAPRSVNMARYRLRQKLNFEKDDSLDDFVRGLIQ